MGKYVILRSFVSGCKTSMGFSFKEGRTLNEKEVKKYFDESFVEAMVRHGYMTLEKTETATDQSKTVRVVEESVNGTEVVSLDKGVPLTEAKTENPRRLLYPKNMFKESKRPLNMPIKVVEETRYPLNTVERPAVVDAPVVSEDTPVEVKVPAEKVSSKKKAPSKKPVAKKKSV